MFFFPYLKLLGEYTEYSIKGYLGLVRLKLESISILSICFPVIWEIHVLLKQIFLKDSGGEDPTDISYYSGNPLLHHCFSSKNMRRISASKVSFNRDCKWGVIETLQVFDITYCFSLSIGGPGGWVSGLNLYIPVFVCGIIFLPLEVQYKYRYVQWGLPLKLKLRINEESKSSGRCPAYLRLLWRTNGRTDWQTSDWSSVPLAVRRRPWREDVSSQ